MRSASLHLCWLPLAALGLGCGSQASTEYFGESLISLRGSVVVDNPDAPADLVPVLAFERPRPGTYSNSFLLEDVVHRGEFPARFQLGVFAPPAASVLYDVETDSGRRLQYAWASIAAVAPEHPGILALTLTFESSYCLGRECYRERRRCDEDSCYEERHHCSLPARFDERDGAFSNCREVDTRGDLDAVPASLAYAQFQADDVCTQTSCQLSYEWCSFAGTCEVADGSCGPPVVAGKLPELGLGFPDACEVQAGQVLRDTDGSCHPPAENCYARIVECDYDPQSQRPSPQDELDPARWGERTDLSNCGVLRQGNLDYAESYDDWLAGISEDAFVVFVPEGFDPVAFEEWIGVVAPEKPGYSLLVLAEWDDSSLAEFDACSRRTQRTRAAAYNLEHGTEFPADDVGAWSQELFVAWMDDVVRCQRSGRASWSVDPLSADLRLHVDLPPAFAN